MRTRPLQPVCADALEGEGEGPRNLAEVGADAGAGSLLHVAALLDVHAAVPGLGGAPVLHLYRLHLHLAGPLAWSPHFLQVQMQGGPHQHRHSSIRTLCLLAPRPATVHTLNIACAA